MLNLSDQWPCVMTSVSLTGESGMKPQWANSSLPWGSSRRPCRSKCGDCRPDHDKLLDFVAEMASRHSSASDVMGQEAGKQEDLELGYLPQRDPACSWGG